MKAQPYTLNPEPVRWSVIAPLIAAVVFFAPIPPWVVDDFYSRDMYPWMQGFVTSATNVLPLAILDLLLILTLLLVLFRIRRLFMVMRQRGIMDALWEATRRIVRAASFILILFYWAWGFNYHRLPLDKTMPGGRVPQLTLDAVQTGFSDASTLASRLRPLTQRDEGNFHTIKLDLKEPMNQALRLIARSPLSTPGDPKYSLVLSPFFKWSGVTGMINPFGLESIVEPGLLPFERPFVLAHEWAHLAGHADEAEASAVGWLACMKAGPMSAYSASLFLITESANAMPEAEREVALARLDAGVKADLDAIAVRMQQQKPAVRDTTSRVYDEYLKANRVADGTASYARALGLILASPFKEALHNYNISR